MELIEGFGESSSPQRSSFGGGGGFLVGYDVRNDVYSRLVENGNEEAISNPEFRDQLDAHFNRLPTRYGADVNMDRVEDVLIHQKLLALAKDPDKRPVFSVQFVENIRSTPDGNDDLDQFTTVASTSRAGYNGEPEGNLPSMHRESKLDVEACSKLEVLNLDIGNNLDENRRRLEASGVPVHEVIFSTIDKPKLLSQLSAMLSDIGLNIREAHVFSTTDGYSLDVFVVDGWPVEETDGLHEAVGKAVARSEGSWSGSSPSHSAIEKALAVQQKSGEWEIDKRLLKIGEKIASGSCGDLYHGVYLGEDVAVKILRSDPLDEALEVEFSQEVAILRKVQHKNVVRFIGACTKLPQLCIVTVGFTGKLPTRHYIGPTGVDTECTLSLVNKNLLLEFMPGGSLYDFLHKPHHILETPALLKFAIDVCKGMNYLHNNNIIHRDLKTANLLMDTDNVVKVADFGVARFQNQGGEMTAETGTYRWMAPEVINHEPYDQKADVFSFAIVLWELLTAKVPYDAMTPLQAALGVRQGLRPDLPKNAHPRLLDLMQRCWEGIPGNRPSFSEITVYLEELLQEFLR